MNRAVILDSQCVESLIEERHKKGLDYFDEVWEGVYVMPPAPTNHHFDIAGDYYSVLKEVIKREGKGRVQQGGNVSDHRKDWEKSYRVPDVLVVLTGGRAVDCDTHWFGGPDFLVEVESPGDDTELKIPFYERIAVKELLIVDRDSHHIRLYRHDGQSLVLVGQSSPTQKKAIASAVVPLTFLRKAQRQGGKMLVRWTEKKRKQWLI